MPFLIGVLILIGAVIFGYFFIKKKVRDFSAQFFGTSNIKSVIQKLEIEAEETPKSLTGMESLALPLLKEDFPELNINEMKAQCENKILECFKKVNEANTDEHFETQKIENWAKDKISKSTKYDSIKIHRTILNKYQKIDNIATLSFRTALQYIYSDNTVKNKKIQTRFETEFIYIIDSSKLSETQKGLSLNCPNCGAPIKNLKEKYCVYCNCGIIDIVKKVWTFNNIKEF